MRFSNSCIGIIIPDGLKTERLRRVRHLAVRDLDRVQALQFSHQFVHRLLCSLWPSRCLMLERRVLAVRGFAEARLARFAKTLWTGSDDGFIAAALSPGMSPIEPNLRQEMPLAFRWRIKGSNPVSLEITNDSSAEPSTEVRPR